MAKETPLMTQYLAIKSEYPGCLLFYRLGDFYELFGDDAKKAAKELDIVLTSRGTGNNNKTPMCGVPYHAAENYLNRLLEKGYKVAICEQLEEAKASKGIVKRDVVRVVTPGTILNSAYLDKAKNNYILSLFHKQDNVGCAWSDISTGEFQVAQFSVKDQSGHLVDLINRLQPAEFIYKSGQLPLIKSILENCWEAQNIISTEVNQDTSIELIERQFGQEYLVGLNRENLKEGLAAGVNLLSYLQETQKNENLPFSKMDVFMPGNHMYLDAMTIRNLELFKTLREGKKEGSLFWALERTLTGMGTRLLRKWLQLPLQDMEAIKARQDSVEELKDTFFLRQDLREQLSKIYDLERIISRIEWLVAKPRDLIALSNSLAAIPLIKDIFKKAKCQHLRGLGESLDPISELKDMIQQAINDHPPDNLSNGGIIKDGYDPKVDQIREIIEDGETWIKNLESEERARTGIKSLKISFNKVFGYYIEITKPNLSLVPENYIRKQTLTQCERFITPELKEQEELFVGATDRLQELEYQLFCDIRKQAKEMSVLVRQNARLIAQIDCLASFAETAALYSYVKPELNNEGSINIKNGRHPILAQLLPEGSYIPNDLRIGEEDNRIHILTGPNMAGKSTYMRQMATLVLMAQCGSFIPAEKAEIGIADRVFVRAGSMDDLGKGQSTFMMEMNEVSYIINHATKDSFIVLDEIGRGTGTTDGLGIAWALVEYFHDQIGPRLIFATHYHQLTQLAEQFTGVANYSVAVAEKGREITFLHKVVPGGTNKSYGIQVAQLANLPQDVIERAYDVAAEMEVGEKKREPQSPVQLVLFDDKSMIIQELESLNLVQMTPLEALNTISSWQQRLLQSGESASSRPKRHGQR
ncbi:MAG: DNA mismatch repair protein MutS [Syntrophaceticus sp.]|nr:DNA mismatch repair protein MutS [Syntrophaceticus sp.]